MDQIPFSIQNPVHRVRSVSTDLSHPESIRLRGYARDLHSSGGQIQEEQDQKAFQTSGSPHLDTEKIRCRDQFPVLRQKLFPSRFSVALRSWFDTVPAQNVRDGATRYLISQIRYRTLIRNNGGRYERVISCIQARIENRIADGEVVYDLPLPGRQVEVAMHFV